MKIKRIIFIVLIIIWMLAVFRFSGEKSEVSSNTSGKTIRAILNVFPWTSALSNEEKDQLVETLQPIARKLAHFSIYTLGGILIMFLAKTFDISTKKRIIYSLSFGILYAVSDEVHQYFVPRKKLRV